MSARLEHSYRRLMLFYPAAYRREFGDEMLGVAMSVAGPDRSRPTVREAADLIGSGIRRRFVSAGQRSVQPQWRPGLAFVNAGLIVFNVYVSVNWVVVMLPEKRILGLVAFAAAWLLALVATVARWRRAAALAAVAGFGIATVLLLRDVHRGLIDLGNLTVALIGVAPCAAAAITGVALALGPAQPATRVRTVLSAVVGGAGLYAVDAYGGQLGRRPTPTVVASMIVALVFVAALRHRNRAVPRAVLIVATYLSILPIYNHVWDDLYPASALRMVEQLGVVTAVPMAVFVVGALLIRRRERRAGGTGKSSMDVTATGAV